MRGIALFNLASLIYLLHGRLSVGSGAPDRLVFYLGIPYVMQTIARGLLVPSMLTARLQLTTF